MMMRLKNLLFLALLSLIGLTLAAKAPRIVPGPNTMPMVTSAMLQPKFWIKRLREPDKVILSARQYQQLREQWHRQGLVYDLAKLSDQVNTYQLKLWLKEDFSYLKRVGQYHADGQPVTAQDVQQLISKVNLQTITRAEVTGRWGLTVRPVTMRLFPSKQIITAKPNDIEFNLLAHSELQLATPVIVWHRSQDQEWLFVSTAIGRGWIPATAVGISQTRNEVLTYHSQATKVLIEAIDEIILFGSKQRLKMGCWLKPQKRDLVQVPGRDNQGNLIWQTVPLTNPNKWQDGWLAPTASKMITQAFKLLDQPYGWGGTQGLGDCSEMIRRLGLCFGMVWPRSTSGLEQGFTSTAIKMQVQPTLQAGETLLTLPGHVMLVIGQMNGQTYVIHNLYGIHGQDKQGQLIKRVARVVVSDLSLGQGSHKGSLGSRITKKVVLAF